MPDKGKKPLEENSFPSKKANHLRVISSSHSLLLILITILWLIFFDFSLDLQPEDIFGTKEIPEYIHSDSSTEEENATHEHKTNHQLRRRIQNLEHDLWDITAHCSDERERRMNLEAVIGGEIFIPIWISCSSSEPVLDNNLFFFFKRVR
jgi:hypothetical protein